MNKIDISSEIREGYCAFIDVLGFKDFFIEPLRDMDRPKQAEVVLAYHDMMESLWKSIWAQEELSKMAHRFSAPSEGDREGLRWFAVSDSLVLFSRDVYWLMYCCSAVQKQLLVGRNLLSIGGIGHGMWWENWGEQKAYLLSTAYVDAYQASEGVWRKGQAKSEINKWPRILLAETVQAELRSKNQWFEHEPGDLRPWVITCEDGGSMVNPFFTDLSPITEYSFSELLACHIDEGIKMANLSGKGTEKWQWFASLLLFLVDDSQKFDKSATISLINDYLPDSRIGNFSLPNK